MGASVIAGVVNAATAVLVLLVAALGTSVFAAFGDPAVRKLRCAGSAVTRMSCRPRFVQLAAARFAPERIVSELGTCPFALQRGLLDRLVSHPQWSVRVATAGRADLTPDQINTLGGDGNLLSCAF